MPKEPPGSYGIEHAVRQLREHLDHQFTLLKECLARQHEAVVTRLECLEEAVKTMATTFQDVKDALAEQNQAILAEMNEVNIKLDELIQEPARLQEIADLIRGNTAQVKTIINTPVPEPDPVPAPSPGRKP